MCLFTSSGQQTNLIFFVNGKKIVEPSVDPQWTLLYYLRNKLKLCGTKLGCAEGGCGACTVMISKYDWIQQKVIHFAVNACLAPVCSMHGLAVTTVEGIGSTKTKLHPVQERIAKAHGSQCGFCTPGIVMSMYTLLRSLPRPSMKDLEVAFQGNLCRCTGYRPIIEGYKTFTEDWEVMQNGNAIANGNGTCAMGEKCCKLQNGTNVVEENAEVLFKPHDFVPYDPSQEPIFPPELKLSNELDKQNLVFKGKEVVWYRPTQLEDLLELKHKYPDAKIIVGNTEVGVEVKFKHFSYPVLIQPTQVAEMTEVKVSSDGVKVGASVTLQEMENVLNEQINSQSEYKTRIFKSIVEMLNWFAGKQIRNVAAVGGNIMTGSPISDLNPIFVAAKIELEVQSVAGKRKVIMDENFFTGYRKNVVDKNEILVSLTLPYTKESQYFFAYKQARRKDDDIAIVNAAINVLLEQETQRIHTIDLVFGGMAPTTVSAPKTSRNLIGRKWNDTILDTACKYLLEDLPLQPNAPGGMVPYRRALVLSFFFKIYLDVSRRVGLNVEGRDRSAVEDFEKKIPKSSQYFQVFSSSEKLDTIGKPIVHLAAYKHASGEAVYCDDIPSFSDELYMGLVLSSKAHADILSIDPSDALKMDGVHGFFSAKDLSEEQNRIGKTPDEVIFVSKTVISQGQILGVVVADNQLIAQKAARKVKVVYEELHPIVISIEDAVKYGSYFPDVPTPKLLESGDVDVVFANATHVIEGSCRTGAQEHFYLETQSCLVVPKNEDNALDVYCSTQYPSAVTQYIAHALGVSQSRIVTKVKRIGGGFGGKETQAVKIAAPAALAASRLSRPVRCMLDRDEDMMITGGRHAFYIKYKVAFDDEGKILACEVDLYNNAGYTSDLSELVMERAMTHFQNAYNIFNVRVRGFVCKTNLPSNAAFRGTGAPQAMLTAEFMIRKIAEYLDKDVVHISCLNLYREGDVTHYNQKLERCTVRRCWDECITSSEFASRREDVQVYNRVNRWKKRGISVVPTQYGVCFPIPHLNQGSVLIHVYTDGSVLLALGGTEMGQGLNTKMIQVASRVLQIPTDKIYISECTTDKVPNAPPTAASFSSDLNGMAVKNGCEILAQRLEPYKQSNPSGTWEEWVLAAFNDRVSLSTTGYFKLPFEGYNWKTNTGTAHHYFTNGVACTEVEIDCLTGDHRIIRTDIVMDVGESLNPAIDIGQIEGAFMQGYGLYMLEEMLFSAEGEILSRGPGTYKIPGFANIPTEFNVSLLKGAPNPRAIYSSKAVGEPPLFLASSVLFAIREAIKAARVDAGLPAADFVLHAPATSAKIRMACEDRFTMKINDSSSDSTTPWNIVP